MFSTEIIVSSSILQKGYYKCTLKNKNIPEKKKKKNYFANDEVILISFILNDTSSFT